ncbi:hypothetical protein [Thalassospira sp. ER-Se-21-Dark]|uniref:hypothetical protein n=1 Tax=Thalassospira sp. ER-Se-21-Dark TaxID=2585190 RepID=UPI001B302EA1|nr:hypothetical protein [Thalassospira sp. ER-Se-21-Dark]MBP3127971.1 hypothetical protein [Thalassospira sp. ER-Se-21-Dark]
MVDFLCEFLTSENIATGVVVSASFIICFLQMRQAEVNRLTSFFEVRFQAHRDFTKSVWEAVSEVSTMQSVDELENLPKYQEFGKNSDKVKLLFSNKYSKIVDEIKNNIDKKRSSKIKIIELKYSDKNDEILLHAENMQRLSLLIMTDNLKELKNESDKFLSIKDF